MLTRKDHCDTNTKTTNRQAITNLSSCTGECSTHLKIVLVAIGKILSFHTLWSVLFLRITFRIPFDKALVLSFYP